MKIGYDKDIGRVIGNHHPLFGNQWRQELPNLLGLGKEQRYDLGDDPIIGSRNKQWSLAEFHTLLPGCHRRYHLDYLAGRHCGKTVYLQHRFKNLVGLVHRDFARRENRHFAPYLIVHHEVSTGQLADKLDEDLDINLVKIHTDGLVGLALRPCSSRRLSMHRCRDAKNHRNNQKPPACIQRFFGHHLSPGPNQCS